MDAKAVIALDVGGAQLKAADGQGFALQRPFALWREPQRLTAELAAMLAQCPPHAQIVATMTGELADCYATKCDGVRAITAALQAASGGRPLAIYLTDGRLVSPEEACERPLLAAASNWHALAVFAGRFAPQGAALLMDIGSTTTDLIPLCEGRVVAEGRTDPERLQSGELVYTGVVRSPLCGLVHELPWRGRPCRVAQELFATTWDAYLTLGDLPEDAQATHTADGRPATQAAAHDRLARMICADRTLFDHADALRAATAVRQAQLELLGAAVEQIRARLGLRFDAAILSGQGEFLSRRLAQAALPNATLVSLTERLGPVCSSAGPAHALAVLAQERLG